MCPFGIHMCPFGRKGVPATEDVSLRDENVSIRREGVHSHRRWQSDTSALLEAETRPKRGSYDRSGAAGKKKSAGQSAYEHRVKADNFMTHRWRCRLPTILSARFQVRFKCALMLTRERMIKAHE
jgi:hypothetical protein